MISSVSTATSLAVALKLGPVHLVGNPFVKFQRIFSLPDDIRTIDPFLRSSCPSATFLCQSQSAWSLVMPRFKMITVYFDCPESSAAKTPCQYLRGNQSHRKSHLDPSTRGIQRGV